MVDLTEALKTATGGSMAARFHLRDDTPVSAPKDPRKIARC